eukprot:6359304-Pyramimonas_sp.AAC.1
MNVAASRRRRPALLRDSLPLSFVWVAGRSARAGCWNARAQLGASRARLNCGADGGAQRSDSARDGAATQGAWMAARGERQRFRSSPAAHWRRRRSKEGMDGCGCLS